MSERLAYRTDEAAALLGVDVVTIQRALSRRELPGRKLGSVWLIPAAAIRAWLDSAQEGVDDETGMGHRESLPKGQRRPVDGVVRGPQDGQAPARQRDDAGGSAPAAGGRPSRRQATPRRAGERLHAFLARWLDVLELQPRTIVSVQRHQRTFHIEGCRVLFTWRLPSGRMRIKVTDPKGDEAHEMDLGRRLLAGAVTEMLEDGIEYTLRLGPIRHIDDHKADDKTETDTG